MPEGDTIYVHAQVLTPRLVGKPLVDVFSRWPGVVQGLVGRAVQRLTPIGKQLLIDVDDGTTLRVHLGMKGTWQRVDSGARFAGSLGNVSLRLDTAEDGIVCAKAPTVERFRTRDRPSHRVLAALGPDLLDPAFSPEAAVERLERATGAVTVSEVLLDQRVACGIGNVYKSEVLFLEGVDPFTPASDVAPDVWRTLYAHSAALMRRNLRSAPRNTTGLGPGRPRLWVYGRRARGCLQCGTRIRSAMQGRDLPRVTYWCPRCQSSASGWHTGGPRRRSA